MSSETTAAATGAVGVVRHDPMAMLPFAGYDMGDYFRHWLEMGRKIVRKPKIFNVNWFRTDENGQFIWPGFGDNLRVLLWIIARCEGKVGAAETPIGFVPNPEDVDTEGLDIGSDVIKDLLYVDRKLWIDDIKGIREFYNKVGDRMPEELLDELDILEKNLYEQK